MFLQLIGSEPTASGVWVVFAGQLLDTFTDPPSAAEMHQRLQTTITRSEDLKTAPAVTPEPSTSAPIAEDPATRARDDKIKAQLAARRAKLEAAMLKHGMSCDAVVLT